MRLSECFRILNLEGNESPEDVKAKFREMLKVSHPIGSQSDSQYRQVIQAYKEIAKHFKGLDPEEDIEPELLLLACKETLKVKVTKKVRWVTTRVKRGKNWAIGYAKRKFDEMRPYFKRSHDSVRLLTVPFYLLYIACRAAWLVMMIPLAVYFVIRSIVLFIWSEHYCFQCTNFKSRFTEKCVDRRCDNHWMLKSCPGFDPDKGLLP